MQESQLAGYRGDPGSLLNDEERGGGIASTRVRNAVASDPSMVQALLPTMRAVQGDRAKALGIGLGSAAQICSRSRPEIAQSIQKAVDEAQNAELQNAFAAMISDRAVLSVGGNAPGGSFPGVATLGGGPHRSTDVPNYGFTQRPATTSQPSYLTGSLSPDTGRSGFASTTVFFGSVSGAR